MKFEFQVKNGRIDSKVNLEPGNYVAKIQKIGKHKTIKSCRSTYFYLLENFSQYTGYTIPESRFHFATYGLEKCNSHGNLLEYNPEDLLSIKKLEENLDKFITFLDGIVEFLDEEFCFCI